MIGKALIACEESQAVCIEMRRNGWEAYSCDLEPCSGGHPEWHIQDDVLSQIDNGDWDIMIAHPPCTYLTAANTYLKRGCSKYTAEEAELLQRDAILFFFSMIGAPIKYTAVENPIGVMSRHYRAPDQIIQPWQFGHAESKATCLWLKGLPKLEPTEYADFKNYRCKCGNIFPVSYGKYGCCKNVAKPLWDNQTKSGQNKLTPSKNGSGIAEGGKAEGPDSAVCVLPLLAIPC